MKIDISNSPYYPEFKSGYVINHKKEGRRYVVLVRDDQTKSCTSYARFLMSVKLGRRLLKEEQVEQTIRNLLMKSLQDSRRTM